MPAQGTIGKSGVEIGALNSYRRSEPLHAKSPTMVFAGPMIKRTIVGKITVEEGVTTVDLHVGGQTLKLTIAEARALAQQISSAANSLHEKIWPEGKTKA